MQPLHELKKNKIKKRDYSTKKSKPEFNTLYDSSVERIFSQDSKILNSNLKFMSYPYRKKYMHKHYIAFDKNI